VIEVELPYPPSVNRYYRYVGRRVLISREGRRYRQRVVAALAALGVRTMAGRLRVHVYVFPPDRRVRDMGNLQKALLDALQHGGAYRDDSQIDKLTIERCPPVPGGRTVVQITQSNGRQGTRSERARTVQSEGNGQDCG